MKKCPSCKRYYDDSQSFCLDDGIPLETETEAETVVLPKSSSRKYIIPVIIFGVLILLGGGVAVWWGLNSFNSKTENAQNNSNIKNPGSPVTKKTPSPSPPNEIIDNKNISENTSNEIENANVDQLTNEEVPDKTEINTEKTKEKKYKSKPIRQQAEFFTFELLQCDLKGTLVSCDFRITNDGEDRDFGLRAKYSLAVDNMGKQYKGYNVMTSELSNVGNGKLLLVSEVPVKAKLMIQGVDPNAETLALLNLKFCYGSCFSSDEVDFRKVPLVKK